MSQGGKGSKGLLSIMCACSEFPGQAGAIWTATAPPPQHSTGRFTSTKQQNFPNAGACRILTQTGRGDKHTATPARAKNSCGPRGSPGSHPAACSCTRSCQLRCSVKHPATGLSRQSFPHPPLQNREGRASGSWGTPGTRDSPRGFVMPKLCRRHCNTACVLGVCLAQSQHPCTHLFLQLS